MCFLGFSGFFCPVFSFPSCLLIFPPHLSWICLIGCFLSSSSDCFLSTPSLPLLPVSSVFLFIHLTCVSPASLHLHLSCFVCQSSRYRVIRCVPMILQFWFPDVPPCLSVPCITVILIMLHLLLFLPAVSCFWLHLLCSGVIIMTGAPFKLSSPYMCGIHYFKGTNKNLEICDLITYNITYDQFKVKIIKLHFLYNTSKETSHKTT